MKIKTVSFVICASLLVMSAFPACSLFKKEAGPDVIFIIIDTLRADRLHGTRNGLPLMPNLEALAKESISFTEAYSQETFTKPSVASILTSLYPEVHGVRFGIFAQKQVGTNAGQSSELYVDVLSPQLPSLPTIMKDKGYTTVGVQTNMQLHEESGFNNGFDQYDYLGHVSASEVNELAFAALENVDGPLFLYVHYMDPHLPHRPPRDVISIFGTPPKPSDEDMELLENFREYYSDLVMYGAGLKEERETELLGDAGRDFMRFMYDCEVRYTDREVAALIDAARERNPDSLIVVVSDHGEELWEHGSFGHTKTAYRELAHIPFIISAPDLEPMVVETPVESIDVAPTIAAYLDIPIPDSFQGRNLLPLVSEDTDSEPVAVYTTAYGIQPWDKIHWQTTFFQEYRLVRNLSTNTTELFNIVDDPYEQHCLAEENAVRISELQEMLEAFLEANQRYLWRVQSVDKVKSSEETVEALRALGYIH